MNRPRIKSGFTLIELLVVVTIIGLVTLFVVPAFASLLKASLLSQAYPMIASELSSARQVALSRNRFVEVRFYLYDDGAGAGGGGNACRAFQSWVVNDDGSMKPLNKVVVWPKGVVFNATPNSSDCDLSSIVPRGANGLPLHPTAGEVLPVLPIVPGNAYKYLAFRFSPDGGTTLMPPLASSDAASPKLWYFSLHNERDIGVGGKPPLNYVTLQIDPCTGDIRTYRP